MNPLEAALVRVETALGGFLYFVLLCLPFLFWILWPCYRLLRYWWWQIRKSEVRQRWSIRRLVVDLPIALRLEARSLRVASTWSKSSRAGGDERIASRLSEAFGRLADTDIKRREHPQSDRGGSWVMERGRSIAEVRLEEEDGQFRICLQGWVRTLPGILPLVLSGYFATLSLAGDTSATRILMERLPLPTMAFLGWVIVFFLQLLVGWVLFVLAYQILGTLFLWVRSLRLPDEDTVENHQALLIALRSAIQAAVAEVGEGDPAPNETWMPTNSPLFGWRIGRFGVG